MNFINQIEIELKGIIKFIDKIKKDQEENYNIHNQINEYNKENNFQLKEIDINESLEIDQNQNSVRNDKFLNNNILLNPSLKSKSIEQEKSIRKRNRINYEYYKSFIKISNNSNNKSNLVINNLTHSNLNSKDDLQDNFHQIKDYPKSESILESINKDSKGVKYNKIETGNFNYSGNNSDSKSHLIKSKEIDIQSQDNLEEITNNITVENLNISKEEPSHDNINKLKTLQNPIDKSKNDINLSKQNKKRKFTNNDTVYKAKSEQGSTIVSKQNKPIKRTNTHSNDVVDIQNTQNTNKDSKTESTKNENVKHENSSKTINVQKKRKLNQKSQVLEDFVDDDYSMLDQFKHNLSVSNMGTIVISSEMNIIYTNNYMTDQLLFSRDEMINTHLFSYVHSISHLDLNLAINELFESNDPIISKTYRVKFLDNQNNTVEWEVTLGLHLITKKPLVVLYANMQEEKEEQWVIDPKSPVQLTWVSFVTFILLLLVVVMPQDMVFNASYQTDLMEVPIAIVFTIDILVNFNLAFYKDEDDSKLIIDRQLITQEYLSNWFTIDFVSTVPVGILQDNLINLQLLKSLKFIRLVRFFRFLRIMRLTKIYTFLIAKGDQSKIIYKFIKHNQGYLDLLKSLKFIRLVRFFRFLRIMRLTKIYTFLIAKGDQSKIIYKFIKHNQGYLDLLKNMMYIQIFAHFYSILQWGLTGQICQVQKECWLRHQLNEDKTPQVSDYNYLLSLNIRIALGLDNIHSYNDIETQQNIMWMFWGLSLFGQGIGNISSFLSYSNKQELEKMQTINQFNDLCIMNNIDARLQNIVIDNIEKQQYKQSDRELEEYSFALSPLVQEQLEKCLYQNFVLSFKLFDKLNTYTLRTIKQNMIINENQKVLIRKDSLMKEIQFIIRGTVNLYDVNMNIINQFEEDEIFGLFEFYAQFEHKQKVNLENIMVQNAAEKDRRIKGYFKNKMKNRVNKLDIGNALLKNLEKLNKNSNKLLSNQIQEAEVQNNIVEDKKSDLISNNQMSFIESNQIEKEDEISNLSFNNSAVDNSVLNSVRNSIDGFNYIPDESKSLLKKLKKEFQKKNIKFKQSVSIQDDFLSAISTAYCSENIKQMIVSFKVIEEIIFNDIDSFNQIQKYYNSFNREIQEDEYKSSQKLVDNFQKINKPSLLINKKGIIFDINDSFCEKYSIIDINKYVDTSIQDLIYSTNQNNFTISNYNKNIDQDFKIDKQKGKVKIEVEFSLKIVKQDRNSKSKFIQQKFAKSMIELDQVIFIDY